MVLADLVPLILLLELRLEQISALSDNESVSLLDVFVKISLAFDICVEFALKNHLGDMLIWRQYKWVHHDWIQRHGDSDPRFIDERGADVPTFLILRTDKVVNALVVVVEVVS